MVAGAVFGLCFYNFIVFFLYYKYKKYGDAPIPDVNYWGVILLFVLFGVYGVQFGDYPRYADIIQDVYQDYLKYSGDSWLQGQHMEPLYNRLVVFCRGNYDLWRLIWYATEFIGVGYILKTIHHNNYQTLLLFACTALFSVCAGRVSWGIAFFYFGVYAFLQSQKYRYLFFVVLSVFAHNSMLVLIATLPLLFFKNNKKMLLISVISIPILAGILEMLLQNFLQLSFLNQDLAYKLENNYMQGDRVGNFGYSIGEKIQQTVERVPLYVLILLLFKDVLLRRIHLPAYSQRFLNIIIAIFSIAHIALLATFGSAALYGRIFYMLYIPVFILLFIDQCKIYQYKSYKWYVWSLWLAFNLNYLKAIYYYSIG